MTEKNYVQFAMHIQQYFSIVKYSGEYAVKIVISVGSQLQHITHLSKACVYNARPKRKRTHNAYLHTWTVEYFCE